MTKIQYSKMIIEGVVGAALKKINRQIVKRNMYKPFVKSGSASAEILKYEKDKIKYEDMLNKAVKQHGKKKNIQKIINAVNNVVPRNKKLEKNLIKIAIPTATGVGGYSLAKLFDKSSSKKDSFGDRLAKDIISNKSSSSDFPKKPYIKIDEGVFTSVTDKMASAVLSDEGRSKLLNDKEPKKTIFTNISPLDAQRKAEYNEDQKIKQNIEQRKKDIEQLETLNKINAKKRSGEGLSSLDIMANEIIKAKLEKERNDKIDLIRYAPNKFENEKKILQQAKDNKVDIKDPRLKARFDAMNKKHNQKG